jgi:hypothetical protein
MGLFSPLDAYYKGFSFLGPLAAAEKKNRLIGRELNLVSIFYYNSESIFKI